MKLIAPSLPLAVCSWVIVSLATSAKADSPDFASAFFAVGFSREAPRFEQIGVDGLGQGKVSLNSIMPSEEHSPGWLFERESAASFVYRRQAGSPVVWRITCTERGFELLSQWQEGAGEIPAFDLTVAQKANHMTLLGLMPAGERRVLLPAVMHFPDMGSFRIRSEEGVWLDYDARRFWDPEASSAATSRQFVRVGFPGASAARQEVRYRLEVSAIHPTPEGMGDDPLFDGVRRGYLNIFQLNPHIQMLANNASSDPCAFTVFKYAEVARHAPELVDGLHPMDLVRMTLDRYLAGAKGYGQNGYGPTEQTPDLGSWKPPYPSLDALPSLLLAATHVAEGRGGANWAKANGAGLAAWAAEILAMDRDGDGLLEYPQSGNTVAESERVLRHRPSNWWDAIMFGHKDAYSNALAYHALTRFAALAPSIGRAADGEQASAHAARLRASYVPAFFNPETGLLAGWRSADGDLHDYGFTFVNGAAVTFGLLDKDLANRLMDRILAKMEAVGFRAFQYGLPGNLIPVRRGDYFAHGPVGLPRWGEPLREDGTDAFQIYENGGLTACYAWLTYHALYSLGRSEDARRLYLPVLATFAEGGFQGFDAQTGMSIDWRDWEGRGHGYEGFLVDNYLALVSVFDELRARSGAEVY